jgi:hypothetical protein
VVEGRRTTNALREERVRRMKNYRPIWILEMRDSDNPQVVFGDAYDDSATAEKVRQREIEFSPDFRMTIRKTTLWEKE